MKLKEKADIAKINEKQEEAKMLLQLERVQQEKDQKRASDWAARAQRIANAMNRMADTVVKKQDEADKELECRIKHYEDEKEKVERLEDERRKRRLLEVNEELKRDLRLQLQQKEL